MSLTQRIAKNATYIIIARTIFRFLTAMVMIYAARYLGVDKFGQYETALAWANAFLALNDLGMSTLIVREAARDEKKMAVYFGNTLLVEIILSLFFYGVIIAIGFGLHYDVTTITLIAILGAAGLAFEFRKVMRGIFRVMLKMKAVAILEVLNGALYFIVTLAIISFVTDTNVGLLGIAHAQLWVNILFVLALFIYTLKFVRPTFSLREIWPMIKQSYVFTLYNMFFMLYFQIDQIIISIMLDQRAVGIYSAPTKIVNFFLFIPIMIFQVIMPTMYKYSQNNIEKYKRINLAIWRYMVAIGLPTGVGLILLSEEIVAFVFGEGFEASAAVLSVMGAFVAVRFFALTQGNSLTTADKQGLRAVIQIFSVIFNIVADIYLIRRYGVMGAVYATLMTEVIIETNYLIASARHLNESIWKNMLTIIPVVISTVVMGIIVGLAKPHVHVIVAVVIGAVSYGILLLSLRFFRAYDKQLLSEIINRKKT